MSDDNILFIPDTPAQRAEMIARIATNEQHLADCREHRETTVLADIMEGWAGTREIDFDYVASIIEYGLEEDECNLARGGIRLLKFGVEEQDPADWWKQN